MHNAFLKWNETHTTSSIRIHKMENLTRPPGDSFSILAPATNIVAVIAVVWYNKTHTHTRTYKYRS